MPSAQSAPLDVTTKNAAPAAPAAPVLSAKTDVSITVTAVAGQEYAIKVDTASSYGAWQDSGSFTGLTAATNYNIITRVKETADAMPSAQSAALTASPPRTQRPHARVTGIRVQNRRVDHRDSCDGAGVRHQDRRGFRLRRVAGRRYVHRPVRRDSLQYRHPY
jgi:hypothetical protein